MLHLFVLEFAEIWIYVQVFVSKYDVRQRKDELCVNGFVQEPCVNLDTTTQNHTLALLSLLQDT